VQVFETTSNSGLFAAMQENQHESLLFAQDHVAGLKGIIAIHNTTLGPAMGGVRMWTYASEEQAIADALRLSRAMTYKSALAGLNVGGGKAVIIGNPHQDKSEVLLRRFGQYINQLEGKFFAAADVGMTEADLGTIAHETPYVVGRSKLAGGSGDSAPLTAYGVFLGIKSAVKHLTGSDRLSNKKVLVQGLGKVGSRLVRHLREEGATVYVYDTAPALMELIVKETGALAVSPEEVYTLPVDVFSPCALGGIINDETLPGLNCDIVAGGANNQLTDEAVHGKALRERGILYAPDFMINAGGIINVSLELQGYQEETARNQTEKIYQTTRDVLALADDQQISTHEAAMQLAQNRIQQVGRLRLFT